MSARAKRYVWVAQTREPISDYMFTFVIIGVFKTLKGARLACAATWHKTVTETTDWCRNAKGDKWTALWNRSEIAKATKLQVRP